MMNAMLQLFGPQLFGQFDLGPTGLPLAVGAAALCLVLLVGWFLRSLFSIGRGGSRSGVFGPLTDAFAAQLPESSKETSEFARLLRQAGLYTPTARASIYALRFTLLFLPLVVAGVLAVLMPPEWTVTILIVGAALSAGLSIIPRLYVYFRRNRRLKEIRNGLADMMDMLSMCLGGGMPLSPSLDHVAKNLTNYPSLAEELQILKRQAELGSMKIALHDMAERIDLPEVRQVTSLLGRGQQLGTRLSTSLLDQADHFRATRRQRATMKANRSPVILTLPLLFCFAPAVLIMLMSPALLELTDFIRPRDGQPNVLEGNERLATGPIIQQLNSLDQDISTQYSD